MSRKDRKFKRFFRPKSSDLQKKKIFAKIQSDFSAEIQNSSVISAQKQVISKKKKKKKKKVFAKIQGDFSSKISQVQTFQGGLFSHGGGLFSIFHRKSASKAQKTCDFAYFTSQWGGARAPSAPPLATLLSTHITRTFATCHFNIISISLRVG